MKVFGAQLAEGSAFTNLTVASGTAFPAQPNSGELFYRIDTDPRVIGLYVYINGAWERLASESAVTIPSSASFPTLASAGDLFFNTDPAIGLSVFNGSTWDNVLTSNQVSNATKVVDAPSSIISTITDPAPSTVVQFGAGYLIGSTEVWLNGVRQKRDVDYRESASNEITLNYAITGADIINGTAIIIDYLDPAEVDLTPRTHVSESTFVILSSGASSVLQLPSAFEPGSTQVWYNGLRQKRTTDFSESGASEITLNYNVTDADLLVNIIIDYDTL